MNDVSGTSSYKLQSAPPSVAADCLRFFFAVAVLFVHWQAQFSASLTSFPWHSITAASRILTSAPAHYGVLGFIVVSGFCIQLSSKALDRHLNSIASFGVRRLLRIVPVILGAGTVAWLVNDPGLHFFQALSLQGVLSLNGPIATVFIELLLYAAYVPLILLIQWRPALGWAVVTVVAVIGLAAPLTVDPRFAWPLEAPSQGFLGFFPF
jgi:hypothetical protein